MHFPSKHRVLELVRPGIAALLAVVMTSCSGSGLRSGTSSAVPNVATASTGAQPLDVTTAATAAKTTGVPFPPAPDSDPFYAQPNPVPNVAAGTVLASRSVTYEPDSVPMTNQAWQIQFVSRDLQGKPIAAVATVVKPLMAPSGVAPLLAFGFAEDGLGAQCAPSHGVTGSTVDSNELLETGVPTSGLALGWTLVIPDYEGPTSAYAAGPLEGKITLDSIRAAESFAPLGLSRSTPVGLAGYSGGAAAVAWAATIEHAYAPHLDIVGVATGGTPADIAGIIRNIDTNTVSNAAFFSIIFMATIGVNRAYPSFMTPILNAAGTAAATAMENGCVGKNSDGSSGPTGTFATYESTSDPFASPGYKSTLPLITLPQSGRPPVTNVFVYHSITDELIPIAGADTMVAGWCAAGAQVEYYRATTGDHVSTELANEPFVLAYLTSRFNGTTTSLPPTTTTCN